jgi:hypothetical protein
VFQGINNVQRYTRVVGGRLRGKQLQLPGRKSWLWSGSKIAARKIEIEKAKGVGSVRDREVNLISQLLVTLQRQIRTRLQ